MMMSLPDDGLLSLLLGLRTICRACCCCCCCCEIVLLVANKTLWLPFSSLWWWWLSGNMAVTLFGGDELTMTAATQRDLSLSAAHFFFFFFFLFLWERRLISLGRSRYSTNRPIKHTHTAHTLTLAVPVALSLHIKSLLHRTHTK